MQAAPKGDLSSTHLCTLRSCETLVQQKSSAKFLDHIPCSVQQTPPDLHGDVNASVEKPALACKIPGLMSRSGPQLL